jgi:F-type H+-transporting ATPase subunit epsilon
MSTIALEIMTPERLVFTGNVEMLIARGTEGELGVLPGHIPLITALRDSVLRIRQVGGGELLVASRGGFMEVNPDAIAVLADEAELAPGHAQAGPHPGS